ncbi:MAG TPA: hypothetical protein VGY77_01420 [Gemmataceae bacterium]|nr:hypothetical protein [Gemmataceae bacterium]
MQQASWIFGLLLTGSLLGAGNPVFSQGISERERLRSHWPIPGSANLNVPHALTQKMEATRQLSLALELINDDAFMQKLGNSQLSKEERTKLTALRDAFKNDQLVISPIILTQFESALKNSEEQYLDPEAMATLREILDKGSSSSPREGQQGSRSSPSDANSSQTPSQDRIQSGANTAHRDDSGKEMNGASSHSRGVVAEWLLKQLEKSPELQEFARDFRRDFHNRDRLPLGSWGDSWGDNLAQMVGPILPKSEIWMEKILPQIRDIPLPSFGGLRLPEIKAPPLPSMEMPVLGVPDISSPKTGMGLLLVPVLVIFAVVVWKVMQKINRHKAGGEKLPRRQSLESLLGPWSVSPSALRTKEDLIRAFEYLSLMKLGPEARSWNHREIARELGGIHEERRRAAGHLAGLYEQARYAPDVGPIPTDAMQIARHELAFLAGGTGA